MKTVVARILVEAVHNPDVSKNIRIFCDKVADLDTAKRKVAEQHASEIDDESEDVNYSDPEPGYLMVTVYSDGTISHDPIETPV